MAPNIKKVECPDCKGEGFVADSCGAGPKICWKCIGLGEITTHHN